MILVKSLYVHAIKTMTSRQFEKQIPKRQDIMRIQYIGFKTRRMQVETIQSQSPPGFESDIVFS